MPDAGCTNLVCIFIEYQSIINVANPYLRKIIGQDKLLCDKFNFMNIDSKLIKYITFPLWSARDADLKLYFYLYKYRKYNEYDTDEVMEHQFASLKKILTHAYDQTEYYKSLFDQSDFDVNNFNDVDMIKKLPILTKEIIWENQTKLIARNIRKRDLLQSSTGGSTGTPLVFIRDKECILKRKAQELFFDKWMGYEIGDKIALFVSPKHSPKGLHGFKSKLRNATHDRILAFDPYRIDDLYMKDFLLQLRKFKPKIIKCFPNSLYIFASFLKKQGIDDIQVAAVSCTGETLYDHQRRLFEEVFQCPVFEKYGTFESGVISCECVEHEGMHIFSDGVFVEFINDRNKPAESRELANIVITDLFNYGMPFIRYKIGDVGIFTNEECKCGSKLPKIKKLCGRDRDILVANNGNPKPGYLFVEVFNKNKIPGKFQVIQENLSKVTIKIVKMLGYKDEEHEMLIRQNFCHLLGETITIDFKYVDQIPREPSGKYKYVHGQISPF